MWDCENGKILKLVSQVFTIFSVDDVCLFGCSGFVVGVA